MMVSRNHLVLLTSIYMLVFLAVGRLSAQTQAPTPTVLTSPLIGAQTKTSLKVWTLVSNCSTAALAVGKDTIRHDLTKQIGWNGHLPVCFEVKGLSPGESVQAQLLLDGQAQGEPILLRTAPAKLVPEWSFMMGSCALYGLGVTRMIKPGRHTDIFDEMTRIPTDFMLWLGDNVYLLNGEWKDNSRLYEKYTKVRLEPHTNAFLVSRPQYAILDDHDFGPDNAEGDFPYKDATLKCFKDFWPNPPYAEPDQEGSYYQFDYQDASFFMLDDRWYRDSRDNKQVLGPGQMHWLQQALKANASTFKFIALGSQVLSEANPQETWSRYPERQVLLDFIREERISGVIFLTGDRHFTELCRLEVPGLYPLYDFTSSPISSILRRQVNRKGDPEYNNALRIEGTKVVAHNFGKVTITGPQGARICRLETFDDYGQSLWTHDIPQSLLNWDIPTMPPSLTPPRTE